MFARLTAIVMAATLFAGCASVPMAENAQSSQVKLFPEPPAGQSALYIYRDSSLGGALKKDVWVDGECLGETAPKVFFYKTVAGDKEHTISTESEFSPNDLKLFTRSGSNYFVRQYIKVGVFVGGANLKVVDEEQGRKAVAKLSLARAGTCSK
mgnify:CR=1 FL=1